MDHRAVLLRVVFASLALAAGCGAVGILYADYDQIWQVTWTAVLTAIAALLLLAATRRVERGAVRRAVLAAVAFIVTLYLLIVAATWDLFGLDTKFALTALFTALVGVPALAFVRMLDSRTTRWAGRAGLALAAVEAVLLLIVTWGPSWLDHAFNLDDHAAALAPAAALAVICLIGAGTGDRRHWRWAGVAASAAGFVILAYHAATEQPFNPPPLLYYLAALAGVVAHANVCMLTALRADQRWLRRATIAAGLASGAFTCWAVTWSNDSDFPGRAAGAAALVAGCGTLALLVVARVNQRLAPAPTASIPDVRELTIVCPVCQRKQPLPVGGARCAGCNLLILVRVEEPRCAACGYSLLMLKTPNCPECGAPVEAALVPPMPAAAMGS